MSTGGGVKNKTLIYLYKERMTSSTRGGGIGYGGTPLITDQDIQKKYTNIENVSIHHLEIKTPCKEQNKTK